MADRDYIGPDPVAWISRLRDVNEASQFQQAAKDEIESTLSDLQRRLAAHSAGQRP